MLRCRRELARACHAAKTAEQRERRLKQQRERDRTAQSSERRESTLQRMCCTSRDRLTNKTIEEIKARLQRMSDRQHNRLHGVGDYQGRGGYTTNVTGYHLRLLFENRETRLEYCRDRFSEQQVLQSQLSLFEQCCVRTKMLRFHAHITSHGH